MLMLLTPPEGLYIYRLRHFLLVPRVQWYKEPRSIDPFECVSCVVVGAIYHFLLLAMGIEPEPPVWVESALTIRLHCPS